MKLAIETKDLCKRFGGVLATHDVSFKVPAGELRCLIGPNGAGKSTLFKLVAGIERPDSGKIWIFGDEVLGESAWRRVRRGVGVKLQSNRAYKNLDVAHNLRVADTIARQGWWGHARPTNGVGITRETALQLFGIEDVVKANPIVVQLSHAEQQWLEICCAISPSVGLLLLDEPTAGMGVEETAHTAKALRALQQQWGLTIIVVEHDMEFVRVVGDRVTVLHQGEILAEGGMDVISAREDVRNVYLG